ncbi:hypothetical protein H6784_00600 [Candidatus Nomurabacteria bacterium]|nr:hypothetical protein [Candidatus Kaiserbacteria bacterium]MCB9813893.1 hypothetical protein [Candidatus Nomurabacteria bacterium]
MTIKKFTKIAEKSTVNKKVGAKTADNKTLKSSNLVKKKAISITKKTVTKAINLPDKAVKAKKAPVRTKVAKKIPSTVISNKTTKSKVDKKVAVSSNRKGTTKTPKKIKSEKDSVVKDIVLPTNMSQRSVEKSMVLNNEFFNNFQNSAFKIAYVSGLCLVLVGLSYTSVDFIHNFSPFNLSAEVIGSTKSNSQPTTYASIELNTVIPDYVINTYPVTFKVINADDPRVKLIKIGSSVVKALNVEKKTVDRTYGFVIPGSQLDPGVYSVTISAMPFGATSPIVNERIFEIVKETPMTKTSTETDATNTAITIPSQDIVNSSDNTIEQNIVEPPQLNLNEVISIEKPIETKEEETNLTPEVVPKEFSISSPDGSLLSGSVTIRLSAPSEYTSVDLYARPEGSTDLNNIRHIAHALSGQDNRRFIFDSAILLSDGKYQLFAETNVEGNAVRSRSISVSVKNRIERTISTNQENPDSFAVSDIVSIKKPREFVSIENASTTDTESALAFDKNIQLEVKALFAREDNNIDELLKRYAIAVQSGDESLIRSAKEGLQEERERMITLSIRDEDTRNFSDSINEKLKDIIGNLQSRVDTFEQLRRDRSGGETAIDTDQDGISDFDEINLYRTDPKEADTDNDGFTDGIEIIKGYNPLSSESEVVVEFESPKESLGLVRDEVLKIDNVLPVVKIEPKAGDVPVTAEIRGKSLPNSYVTLYIFSSPTIVTIKTDADGSFVYNFDKELDDGQHEVYAAITDNAGEIIAQSNPFSFIKEAQAFTPVDAASSEVVTGDLVTQSTKSSYGAVAGMGILALGLILIMLGITLRPKKDGVVKDDDEEIYIDPTLPAGSPLISTKVEHIETS